MSGANLDEWQEQIQYIHQRVAQLRQRAEELPLEQQPQEILALTFQELSNIFETLQIANNDRKQAEETLQRLNEELENRVKERTSDLEQLNRVLIVEIALRARVEATLRQREQEFRALVENTPDIIVRFDQELRHLYINPVAEQVTGIPPTEFIGKTNRELGMPEPNLSDWEQLIARVFETGQQDEFEFSFVTPTGLKYFQGRYIPELAADGSVASVLGIISDITNRKQVEEALHRRQQEFEALVENAPDIITRFNRELRHIYVNPAIELATGLSARDFIGKTHQEVGMPSELVAFWGQNLQALFETGVEQEIEFSFSTPNGLKYYQSRHVPEYRTDGSVETVLAITRDITTIKQAEEALRESEERFRQLAENIHEVFWMSSVDSSKIIYISPAYEQVWGRTCESLYEEPLSWFNTIHPEDRDRVVVALESQRQGVYDVEYRIMRPDGSIRWIRDRGFPVRDAQGQIYRIAGIAEDITLLKQVEQEVYKTLQKERELSELKSGFVSMTSHEFRNPLAVIQSSAELLERYRHRFSEDKQLTHLHRIQTAAQRMTQMLDDILVLAKAEAGKLEFHPTPVDLVQLCRTLVEDLQLTTHKTLSEALPKQLIAFTCQYQCIPTNVDGKLLRHILSNLLSNALKYSPSGSTVRFDLSCLDNYAVFQIQDRGIGIPPEDQPRLFSSFHRASNVGTIPGTGLGLAIVKQCVDLHRGEITVESEIGQGTTFTVTLPLSS